MPSDPAETPEATARRPKAAGRLRGSTLGRVLAASLGAAYFALVYRTTRWRIEGAEHYERMQAEPAFIALAWHSRLGLFPMLRPTVRPRRRRVVALISTNADGDLIARLLGWFRIDAARGSSRDPRKADKDKGAAEAAADLTAALRDGAIVAITPDGPRGPRLRMKAGAAVLAIRTGVPVLPIGFSVARAREFNSWDRFLAPWPFNRGAVVFGAPIAPPPAGHPASVEWMRTALEAGLLDATRRADALVGRETPAPGRPLGPDATAAPAADMEPRA